MLNGRKVLSKKSDDGRIIDLTDVCQEVPGEYAVARDIPPDEIPNQMFIYL